MLYVRFYKDHLGEWRWRAQNEGNGHILAVSSEGYVNRQDCIDAAFSVMDAGTGPVQQAVQRLEDGQPVTPPG